MYKNLAEPCMWSAWEEGKCSVTCGEGIQTDTRFVVQEASPGMPNCFEDPIGYQREVPCKREACPRKYIINIILI